MTLVASFSVDNQPVLLGDLMLSCEDDGRDYKPFPTPLHHDPNREVRGKQLDIVAGLTQKVILLSPRLAVAWSGRATEAEDTIGKLQGHIAQDGYSVRGLMDFLDACCSSSQGLYLTGLMTLDPYEGNTPVVQFSWPFGKGVRFTSGKFGDCYIGGKGQQDFSDLVRSLEGLQLKPSRTTNTCENAISSALSLAAQLSGEQTRLGTGLQDFYGGGFELVTLFGGQLAKVEDITYHLWNAEVLSDGQVTITFHSVVKYCYHEDTLLVRHLEPATPPTPSIDDLFLIFPVHRKPSEIEKAKLASALKPPPFDSQFSVFYVHVPQAVPHGRSLYLIHYRGNNGETPVRFIESANGLEFELSPELVKRISTSVQRATGGKVDAEAWR